LSRKWTSVSPWCGAALEHDDVRAGAAADDFEHYDRILARRALEATPDFRWCTRAAGPCKISVVSFLLA
jgi:hypothetical protein